MELDDELEELLDGDNLFVFELVLSGQKARVGGLVWEFDGELHEQEIDGLEGLASVGVPDGVLNGQEIDEELDVEDLEHRKVLESGREIDVKL